MKIEGFVKEMKKKTTSELLAVSGGGKSVEKDYAFKAGTAHIITVRGGAIEKAAITHLILKGVKPPGADKPSDGMVYQMEVFPENPYCPMGHFNTQWTMTDSYSYSMNLDLFPAVRVEDDLTAVRQAMDHVADSFGQDREGMREGLDEHYNMEHWEFPLATKVGCKLLNLKDENLDLFTTAYRTFFDAYLEIIGKRKDTPCGEEEMKRKGARNGKWLEYIAFKDRAVKMAQAFGMPAEILTSLSFPPSAAF